MMTILDELSREETWEAFLNSKRERNQLTKKELRELEDFIHDKAYLRITGTLSFGLPEKKILSKLDSSKKRTVYMFSAEENQVLKLLAHLLYKYDGVLSDNCYSFRMRQTAKTAFDKILRIKDLDKRYVLKVDIHDYFNSIDTKILEEQLREVLAEDLPLYGFLEELLEKDACVYNGETVKEKRGAMAGVPLSSFFANLYLRDLDFAMEKAGIPYFRYSDDIIVFAQSEDEREEVFRAIMKTLEEKKLELNPSKVLRADPGESWNFLGFRYEDGKIDLSDVTVTKMKGKIRRYAKKLYRKRKRAGKDFDWALKTMIRHFDAKFYDFTGDHEFTWTRFYFPVITDDKGLHAIDAYMQEYLRFLESGRHYKGNYRITYEDLTRRGYTPLVSEYYRWKEENRELNRQNQRKTDQ